MNTRIIICPFGLFGSPGTAGGAELLADALHELLADNAEESRPTRADAYRDRVTIHELSFDTLDAVSDWQAVAAAELRAALAAGDFVIWVGGNHLSLLPVYETFAERGTVIVQFDAHLDVYTLSDSQPELNHGNFLRHAAKLPTLVNVGHRDLFLPAAEVAKTFAAAHSAVDVACRPGDVERSLAAAAKRAKRVFVDVDCDVFDPAYFPAVAHPLPFGLSPATLVRLVDGIWSNKLAGIGVSEFDAGRDGRDQSLATLIWLMEWLLLHRYNG